MNTRYFHDLATLLTGGNLAALGISVGLGIAYFGFFFDDNLFYFAFFGLYFAYLLVKQNITQDPVNRFLLILFLCFAGVITISNLARIFDLSILEFDGRDWRVTFHPLVCIMFLDATYSMAKHYEVKFQHVAGVLLASIVLGTITFVVVGQDRSITELFSISRVRSAGILERNVNLADDVYFFLTCSMAAMLIYFRNNRRWFWPVLVVCGVLAGYFMLMIIAGQSRAGWLGILTGVGVTLLYGIFYRRYILPIIMVAGALLIGYLQFDNISERVLQERGIYEDLWDQWQTTGKIDISKIDENRGIATHHRIQGYENAWVLLKDSPWVGHGGFNPEKLKHKVPYGENLVFIVHTHNIFVDVAIRQGIGVGLVYGVLLIFPILLAGWICGRSAVTDANLCSLSAILLAYAIYVLVENMVDLSYIRSDPGVRIQYLYFALSGLALAQLKMVAVNSQAKASSQGI